MLSYWTRHRKRSYSSNDQTGMTVPIQGPYWRPKDSLKLIPIQHNCDSGANSISSGTPQGKDFTCQNPEIKTERCVCFFKCTGMFSRLHGSQWIRHTRHQERKLIMQGKSSMPLLGSLWERQGRARWTG